MSTRMNAQQLATSQLRGYIAIGCRKSRTEPAAPRCLDSCNVCFSPAMIAVNPGGMHLSLLESIAFYITYPIF